MFQIYTVIQIYTRILCNFTRKLSILMEYKYFCVIFLRNFFKYRIIYLQVSSRIVLVAVVIWN